jgi:DNA polymerase (family X)
VDSAGTARGPRRDRGGARRPPAQAGGADLRGDLHAHTKATDGHDSLREMALAAKALGLEYLAITEHSRHPHRGARPRPLRLARQCDEIDRLNPELDGITLLKGIEVDILEDGSLDLPDDVLGRLDLVVGAVHSRSTCRARSRPPASCARWTIPTSPCSPIPAGA